MICTCDNLGQDELQKEKDRNTELVADSKQLSSLKKVQYIVHDFYVYSCTNSCTCVFMFSCVIPCTYTLRPDTFNKCNFLHTLVNVLTVLCTCATTPAQWCAFAICVILHLSGTVVNLALVSENKVMQGTKLLLNFIPIMYYRNMLS